MCACVCNLLGRRRVELSLHDRYAKSFNAALRLCHLYFTIDSDAWMESGGCPVCQQSLAKCFQRVRDLENMLDRATVEQRLYRRWSIQDRQHAIFCYLVIYLFVFRTARLTSKLRAYIRSCRDSNFHRVSPECEISHSSQTT